MEPPKRGRDPAAERVPVISLACPSVKRTALGLGEFRSVPAGSADCTGRGRAGLPPIQP